MSRIYAVSLVVLVYVCVSVINAEQEKKLSSSLSDDFVHSNLKKREADYDKRSWQKASGMWGKRSDGLDAYWAKRGWEKGAGLWGKRGDSWSKASGMWGKRSLNDILDGYNGEIYGYDRK